MTSSTTKREQKAAGTRQEKDCLEATYAPRNLCGETEASFLRSSVKTGISPSRRSTGRHAADNSEVEPKIRCWFALSEGKESS